MIASLYRPLVGLTRLADAAGDGRLLDDLGYALQGEQREADRDHDLDRPAQQPAGVR